MDFGKKEQYFGLLIDLLDHIESTIRLFTNQETSKSWTKQGRQTFERAITPMW